MQNTRTKSLIYSIALIALVLAAVPLFAHHGTAAFDTSKEVTVKGNITDFVFSNPHVQLFFEAKNDKGEKEMWQGELTAPNKLMRAGWNKHSLKPGDSVVVSGYQVKSGEHTMWVQKLIGPDGQPMSLRED